MKKLVVGFLVLGLLLGLATLGFAAEKKAPAKVAPAPAAPTPAAPPAAAPAPSVKKEAKSGLFIEAGFGGGAGVIEGGYARGLTDKITLTAGIGYGVGNGYGVAVIDIARLNYNMGGFFLGGGLNYAMYSATVTGIPGISGAISSKNLFGVELLGGTRIRGIIAKISYSTALGIRASAAYEL